MGSRSKHRPDEVSRFWRADGYAIGYARGRVVGIAIGACSIAFMALLLAAAVTR
jgi:hypothetical protein